MARRKRKTDQDVQDEGMTRIKETGNQKNRTTRNAILNTQYSLSSV
jgi:hypothetical protein